jgi:hypothetical protein
MGLPSLTRKVLNTPSPNARPRSKGLKEFLVSPLIKKFFANLNSI